MSTCSTQSSLKRRGRPYGSATRFANITQDARALKVTRNWLWMVLTQRGTSAPLLEKYRALKSAQHPDQTHMNLRLGADPAEIPASAPAMTATP